MFSCIKPIEIHNNVKQFLEQIYQDQTVKKIN